MVEKFADYEGQNFLQEEGTFDFEIVDAELTKAQKSGNDMVKFTFKCDAGTIKANHVLIPSARWSYNKLISAALNLTAEERKTFELDYMTIHNKLIGKHVYADVNCEEYEKVVKKPLDDGTFEEHVELAESFKLDTTSYKPV